MAVEERETSARDLDLREDSFTLNMRETSARHLDLREDPRLDQRPAPDHASGQGAPGGREVLVPVIVAEDVPVANQLEVRGELGALPYVLPVRLSAVPLLSGAPVKSQRHRPPRADIGYESVGHLWRAWVPHSYTCLLMGGKLSYNSTLERHFF